MATAVSSMAAESFEVRVWGMDLNDKPFIQSALARQASTQGVLLEGVLPVKTGDTIGVQYQKNKARFKVLSVVQEESTLRRHVGIECVESANIWRFPFAVPMNEIGTAAQYGEKKPTIRTTEVPAAACLPNRRRAQRFACKLPVEVRAQGSIGQVYATITDISLAGCYLETLNPFPNGARLIISVDAVEFGATARLQLTGVVRTCHAMVGMGVEFFEASEADQRIVASITERLGNRAGDGEVPATLGAIQKRTAPALEANAKADQARRAAMDLQQLEMALSSEDVDSRLLQEFREAATHARHVLTFVQQWLDLKEKSRDPFIVLPSMTAERVRAAAMVNRHLAIDLDTLELNCETAGFHEMCAQVSALNERLGSANSLRQ